MNICVLGWGSLIWNPGVLQITGNWNNDGPTFPIEFARISNNKRLTLVIKENFDKVETLWATSAIQDLEEARNNLMLREGLTDVNAIGYFDFSNNVNSIRRCKEQLSRELMRWNANKNFDAVIWTDLGAIFSLQTRNFFSANNLNEYLDSLNPNEFALAKEYILKAPLQIQTRFRESLEKFVATK